MVDKQHDENENVEEESEDDDYENFYKRKAFLEC